MRGEITRVNLIDSLFTEQDILESFYFCDKQSSWTKSLTFSFDWSNVKTDEYFRGLKRLSSAFCNGCPNPEVPKYSAINLEGRKNGQIRLYKCLNNYEMVGYSSSVCMKYGDWSHKAPRCKSLILKFQKI